MSFALIQGDRICQIVDSEAGCFEVHPSLVWQEVPEDTTTRDTFVDGAVVKEVPPEPVLKSLIISRLTDWQLDDAVGARSTRQQERWRAPDQPSVYFDDAETIAVLTAIGADPDEVLAP